MAELTGAAWSETEGLRWRALAPFGVELDHDLSQPLDEAAAQAFRALFSEHGLILARGQSLSMEQQIALLSLLGHVLRGGDGTSYISSEANYGSAKAELTFHSDYAFTEHPLEALSLHAVDVVDGASSTRFASTTRALDALPRDLAERLAAHRAQMISPDFEADGFHGWTEPDPKALLSLERPSLLETPLGGRRCIGVSDMHAARLLGMEWSDSRDLLAQVFEVLYAPDNVLEHVWRGGDIVIWDNIACQHARGSIRAAGRRVLQRVAVGQRSLMEMHPEIFEGFEAAS